MPHKRRHAAKKLPQNLPKPRNRIALALALRHSSGAAGRHGASAAAQRSANKVALRQSLHDPFAD